MTESNPSHLASMERWVPGPLPGDVQRALERLRSAHDVGHIAVMPDVHLASEVCVGVAVATRRRLLPAAVGSDIGCGMSAVRFDASARQVVTPQSSSALLEALGRAIPIVKHGRRRAPPIPATLEAHELSDPGLETAKHGEGRLQLGTLGRGNHFVELQTDDQGWLWVMVHSGSRGIGSRIRQHHERRAIPDASGLRGLEADAPEGRAYLSDLAWALDYAAENRRRLLDFVAAWVAERSGGLPVNETQVECHHNFVRRESHFGEPWWVHRKGAISAAEGERGIIPGSMGDTSFIVEGRGLDRSLCTSSHGAGRCMSRTEARQRISVAQLRRELRGVCFDERLSSRLRDEAPGAYKDIGAVMRAQRPLTRVITRLRPLVSFKGV